MIGRNFFTDVAPCTHLPHFYGRFREGLRRGRLDDSFSFVYGFDPKPMQVRITLRDAAVPDRYWIITEPVEALEAGHRRDAVQAAVNQRVRAEPVDPSLCEREPIHVPGAIQPHAVLIAAEIDGLAVVACRRQRPRRARPRSPRAALEAVLGADLAGRIRASLQGEGIDPGRTVRERVVLAAGLPVEAVAHRTASASSSSWSWPRPSGGFPQRQPARHGAGDRRLRDADSLEGAARVAARETARSPASTASSSTRFDPDWNGAAIARGQGPGLEPSLLGLHFPASDIPAQARALYNPLEEPLRHRPRLRPGAAGLVDAPRPPTPRSTSPSRSRAACRRSISSISAISGVNGSMSVSILVEGRLWGLMIGHHQPQLRRAERPARAATVLADAFAMRVYELESRRLWQEHRPTPRPRERSRPGARPLPTIS